MRSLSILALVAAACGGGSRSADVPKPVPPDAAPARIWSLEEPIPCTTASDCALVSAAHVYCPGVCGFCPGDFLVPSNYPAIKCPAYVPQPGDEAADCNGCPLALELVAACRAGFCVAEPRPEP